MPMGRASEFTKEIGDQICEQLADGKSVRRIARELGIERATIRRWRDNNESFRSQYARAREEGMDALGDEIVELAELADNDNYNPRRLEIDTKKWVMSKIARKTFGDKSEVEHSGQVDLVRTVNVVRKGG
jgi:transposase-like protein